MRIRLKTVCVGLLYVLPVALVLGVVISRVLGFLHLFGNHAGITLTQQQALDAFNANDTIPRPQLIPKIIHQVFHNWNQPGNNTLPADWAQVRQSCIDLNPDFEVKLWTEESSREFIAREYAWFLKTYDGYSFKVQRVDAIRYFLILHYGGIYIDLDNGCTANLSPLLYYPVWITDGGQGALSNNILAGSPHHPFWSLLAQRLYDYDYRYAFPYVTISWASGQWFETAVWEQYHARLPRPSTNPLGPDRDDRLYRLVMDGRPGAADRWIFFSQERGGTWVNWDNQMFLWIGDHPFVVVLGVLATGAAVVWGGLRLVRGRRGGRTKGYRRLGGGQEGVKDEELVMVA